jgi:hypothetical protein
MGKMNGTTHTVVIAQIENTPAKADPVSPKAWKDSNATQ